MKFLRLARYIVPLVVVLLVVLWYFLRSSGQVMEEPATVFSLNDPAATYIISSYSNRNEPPYLLTKSKNGVTESIEIDGASPVDLKSNYNKRVLVLGNFKKKISQPQCIRAPCPPIKFTLVFITALKEAF